MTPAERFFYEHAGYSHDPRTETAEQGRVSTARALAAAEARLKAGPYLVDHEPSPEPWEGNGPSWRVRLFVGSDELLLLGSVGAVECEENDPHMRVVAAELALEYLPACAKCGKPIRATGDAPTEGAPWAADDGTACGGDVTHDNAGDPVIGDHKPRP
jgi:hypothetical protein